jgi:hypothetical protein
MRKYIYSKIVFMLIGCLVLIAPANAGASLVGDTVYAQMRFDDLVVSTVSNTVQDGNLDLMFIGPYTVNVDANSILISLSPSNFTCSPPCNFNGLDVYDLNWSEGPGVKISGIEVETNFIGFTSDRVTFGDDFVSFNFNELICPINNCDGVFVNANISTIPISPALWLFGSGLIGLIGVARKNKE